ncbi:MAG: Type 1 glutamine amidotransferase-like domain-containing protein [Anaerolineales bacterium]|nr:Type 1 glutamine amidotransferase-like domain-containing protein [Anaerolineales bacterium]
MGYLLLEGGAEFGGAMRAPDLCAIELAGGPGTPIRILPTAAAPDHNHVRAGNNGVRWFQSLGARDVESLPLIDKASANDPEIANSLRAAKLIYLLGGFTHYLGQTLLGSQAWDAALEAWENGAVIAGSSAGAMVMCEHYYDPGRSKVEKGLNLVSNACVLPHHNTFGKSWAGKLKALLPGVTLLGIDEYTGILDEGEDWRVLGGGASTIYRGNDVERYENGQRFMLG